MDEKKESMLEVGSIILWIISAVSFFYWLILVILTKDASYKAGSLCISYFTLMLALICKTDYEAKYKLKKASIITIVYVLLFFFFT